MNTLYKGEPLVKEIIKDVYTQVYLNLQMGGLEVLKKILKHWMEYLPDKYL